jgi:hypothetical protein
VKSERRFVMILLLSGDGQLQVLHPLDGASSAEVAKETPHSWELDDALGREQFIAFFSDEPVAATDARQWAREGQWPTHIEAIQRSCTKGVAP